MKIKKSELKEALETVRPGLATKELIEQSTSFAFSEGAVITFNDEICLRAPVPDLQELTGAIRAEEFYQILTKLDTEEITMVLKDDEVQLKAGKKRAGLKLAEELTLPFSEINIPKKFIELGKGIDRALKFVTPAGSTDMSYPILTCVHITKNFVEATDRYRIAKYKINTGFEEPILIPVEYIKTILSITPDKYAISEGWIHFTNKLGVVCSCRLLEGIEKYPDTSNFIEDKEGQEMQFPENVSEIIEAAEIFGKADYELDSRVDITFKTGKMIIESHSDFGWYKESVSIKYKGDEMQFAITPSLFQDILSQNLTFQHLGTALLFSTENWKYLTMLKNDLEKDKSK